MMWLFAILLVLAMGGIALLAAGKGTPMSEVYDDRPDALVPAEGDLTGDDVRRVRFSLAFRGYRMSEVDALLERLATQVDTSGDSRPAPGPAAAVEPAPPVEPAPVAGAHRAAGPASVPADQPADQPADHTSDPTTEHAAGSAASHAADHPADRPVGEPSAEGRGERRSD